jgi:hypothetical protein
MREIKGTFGEIVKSQKFISKEFDNFKGAVSSQIMFDFKCVTDSNDIYLPEYENKMNQFDF